MGEIELDGKSACSMAEEVLAKLKGVVKVERLSAEDLAEIGRLESEAESKVMMGLCPGTNIGLKEALSKKNVFGCITDETMVWPSCSYIKVLCGDEVLGQDIYDEKELEKAKKEGNIVVGNLVFYRCKIKLLKERREEMRVHMLPMQISELVACGAVVASPSPPTDVYVKNRLGQNINDPHLGTVIVGID
jgi:hypothetical protein